MKSFVVRARSIGGISVLLGWLLVQLALPFTASAVPDPNLTGGSPITSFSGTAAPITDVQVTGTGNPTVPVRLRVTSGSLAMTTTTGLTFTGGSTGATLQFSGTLTNVNTALATLRYTRTGTGTDTLEVSLVNAGEVFFGDNGHLYEYVSFTSSWVNANTNAQTRTKYGATGYLTTITSQNENDFVAARLLNAGWMGASDSTTENDWKWVTGPENGTSFWAGLSGGSPVSGRYANWGAGEPNNAGDEDCAQFLTGGSGKWNDLPCSATTLPGYVVEYGSSTALDVASLNVGITTLAANQYPTTPTSLGPTSSVNASWGNDSTPDFSFTLADPDGADTLRYRIQIDNNMDFSSPTVDYTTALGAQGSRSFTIGQAAGSGTYTTGSSGQTLSDAQYYWRVKAIDGAAAESAYATANSGNIAFRIDTGAPGTPSTPSTTTPSADSTPTWTLGSVTDAMAGFGDWTLEWSQSSTFSSGVSTNTSHDWPPDSSFTHSTPLGDGTWYFRSRATDAGGNVSSYSSNGTVVIDTTTPTVPGTPSAGASSTSNTAPTWTWAASTDSGAGLHGSTPYTVQWSQDAAFGSFSSATATTTSFAIPTSDRLTDGTWYFRVRARDAVSQTSAYSAAGSVVVDATAPSVPGTPVAATSSSDNTPTWTWSSSTDAGVGLDPLAYTLEWSQTADFSGTLYGYATGTPSYTTPSALADGTWYFRVKATDALGNESAYTSAVAVIISTAVRVNTQAARATATVIAAAEPEPTPAADGTSGQIIILNKFDEYNDGSGKNLTLTVGQVVYFTVDGEQHSVTIKEIGDDYVIVTIASTPKDVRIPRGQDFTYDINNDGKDDINIAFSGAPAQTKGAAMVFKQLMPGARAATTPTVKTLSPYNWWPIILAVTGGVSLLLLLWARRWATQSNK